MRNRRTERQKPDYARLQWKVYGKLAIIAACAAVAVIVLREYVRGEMGDFIVYAMRKIFGMSRGDAIAFYNKVFTGRIDMYVYFAAIVAFVIVARFMMSQYARYFNEISSGLDTLVERRAGASGVGAGGVGTDGVGAGISDGSGAGGVGASIGGGSGGGGVGASGVGTGGGEIKLSPEMAAMERKLNAIRLALDKRERDARQAEQRKNDLVTYLAHDIKTPLTSVIGYLSLLREAQGLPEHRRAEYTRVALEKANRLEGLINEFFDITRYNLQTLVLSKESIDLHYMLMQMADEFYPLLSAKGMAARLHAEEDLTVYGDPDKLARVFNNILRNAVEYSPSGSVIDITAVRSDGVSRASGMPPGDGTAHKRVMPPGRALSPGQASPNGGGPEPVGRVVTIAFRNAGSVPLDKLESIFDKFYRLDSARSTGTGGAGLGLAIAKDIVAAHGGTIRADSADGYTTFTIQLLSEPV